MNLDQAKGDAVVASYATEILHVVVELLPDVFGLRSAQYALENNLAIVYTPNLTTYGRGGR